VSVSSLRHQIRLVLLDLDGTALGLDSRLSARTTQVLRTLGKRVKVGFATGRMLGSTAAYAREAEIDLPLVVLNGTLVTRPGEPPLLDDSLPADRARAALAARPPEASHFWITRDEMLAEPRSAARWDYMHTWNNGEEQRETADLADELVRPVFQQHWVAPRASIERLAASLVHAQSMCSRWPSSRGGDWHLELRKAGTDKATGIAALQALYGISADETLVIGDWLNDLGMVNAAGVGVAMGNAHPTLKAAADLVLERTNAEDGAAEFLAEAFL